MRDLSASFGRTSHFTVSVRCNGWFWYLHIMKANGCKNRALCKFRKMRELSSIYSGFTPGLLSLNRLEPEASNLRPPAPWRVGPTTLWEGSPATKMTADYADPKASGFVWAYIFVPMLTKPPEHRHVPVLLQPCLLGRSRLLGQGLIHCICLLFYSAPHATAHHLVIFARHQQFIPARRNLPGTRRLRHCDSCTVQLYL